MTSRLAIDDIEIRHGNLVVRLSPSLRAGLLIAQRYTLDEIRDALGTCNFGTISYLIDLGTDDREKAIDLIAGKMTTEGVLSLQAFAPELIQFVSASMGLTSGSTETSTTEPTFDEPDFVRPLEDLFEFATGWLQWTPAEAWASTPAEIVAARKGHFAMLKAIHGSGEDQPAEHDPHDVPDQAQVKANIAALRDKLGGF